MSKIVHANFMLFYCSLMVPTCVSHRVSLFHSVQMIVWYFIQYFLFLTEANIKDMASGGNFQDCASRQMNAKLEHLKVDTERTRRKDE